MLSDTKKQKTLTNETLVKFKKLAACYRYGLEGFKKDDSIAINYFKQCAIQGDLQSYVELGFIYESKENHKRAFELFCFAAKRDYPQALYIVGNYFRNGYGNIKINLDLAFECYISSAKKNYENAYCAIAKCYLAGIGTSKNEEKAFKWYMKAADAGLVSGLLNVATCYKLGTGVKKDLTVALTWYLKATTYCTVESYEKIAHFYEDQLQDYENAVLWFIKATTFDEKYGTHLNRLLGNYTRRRGKASPGDIEWLCYKKLSELYRKDTNIFKKDEYASYYYYKKYKSLKGNKFQHFEDAKNAIILIVCASKYDKNSIFAYLGKDITGLICKIYWEKIKK